MVKRKLCELRRDLIDDNLMRAIMEDVFRAVDTRPKNNYTVDYNPFYKKYLEQQYEYR